jgi:hypothetical protein
MRSSRFELVPDIREDTEVDEVYSCYCGKVCKGLTGLQAHKRSCRILDLIY